MAVIIRMLSSPGNWHLFEAPEDKQPPSQKRKMDFPDF